MNNTKLPAVAPTSNRSQYETPSVTTFSADFECLQNNSTLSDQIEILRTALENGVKLYLSTSIFRYLALTAPYDAIAWENSPAKLKDKWRLAMLIIKNEADYDMIENIFNGGTLYPIEEESSPILMISSE